jgi:outer membrane protein OmpA-like peptidoglycan-associated protein
VYGNYQIQELDFNSPYADITPAFYKNGLVFASSRDTSSISKREHGWNAQPFLNLYHVTANPDYDTFNIPKELSDILNKKWHESSPVFTQDGNTLYYTRNSEKSPKNNNVSRLMLYKATFNSDLKWIEEKLPFNDMTFSNAHPALSLDGTILYFSSDRPGGFGSTDIYRVAIHNDGTYGIPENLGSKINTTSHDSFPFVSREGYLFFASNGHSGFGALDIFVTDLAENLNNMLIFNLGETINTAQDDFALILNSAKGIGFMTSNRPGGKGSDDIYKIKVLESIKLAQAFEGIVLNRKDRTIIPNAKLEVLDAMGNILATTTSDAKARFNFLLSTNLKEIKIRATKEKYYETLESFDKIALKSDELVLLMDPEIDLALELQLDPIYFDFDKATITNRSKKTLDILVRYLNENQGLHIQVRSHTDSRGNDKYNFELSDRRAFSTKAYLEQRGIKADRISSKGFGESELKNDCKNGSFCSDKDHLFNRRSEFIISNKL